jgi:hypothetical protein
MFAATGATRGAVAVSADDASAAGAFAARGVAVAAGADVAGAAVTGDLSGGSSALRAGDAGAVDFVGVVGGAVEREGCDCTEGTTEIRAGSGTTGADAGAG